MPAAAASAQEVWLGIHSTSQPRPLRSGPQAWLHKSALAPFSNSSREMRPAMILSHFFWMLRQSVTMTPGVAEQSTWQTAASSALPMV